MTNVGAVDAPEHVGSIQSDTDLQRELAAVCEQPKDQTRRFLDMIATVADEMSDLISGSLNITAVRADGQVRVAVSDKGIGIARKHQAQIFNVFTRLHARDKRGGGMGMGRALCQRASQSFDGEISGESAPDEGGAFTVQLLKQSAA